MVMALQHNYYRSGGWKLYPSITPIIVWVPLCGFSNVIIAAEIALKIVPNCAQNYPEMSQNLLPTNLPIRQFISRDVDRARLGDKEIFSKMRQV